METRRVRSTAKGPFPARSTRRRESRPFVLPRPTDNPEREENEDDETPSPTPDAELTVSRDRAADEAGQHIDLRG